MILLQKKANCLLSGFNKMLYANDGTKFFHSIHHLLQLTWIGVFSFGHLISRTMKMNDGYSVHHMVGGGHREEIAALSIYQGIYCTLCCLEHIFPDRDDTFYFFTV